MKSHFDEYGAVELSQRLFAAINFCGRLTSEKKVETGGFLVKTGSGIGQGRALRMVNFVQGEGREIILEPTEKLEPGEEYMGTVHCHPLTPVPSIHDVLTFVADPTEKIMIVHGVDGTINLLMKTEETVPLDPLKIESLKPQYEKSDMAPLVRDYNFAYFQGKGPTLQRAYLPEPIPASKVVALDDLTLAIQGSPQFPDATKKVPKKAHWCCTWRTLTKVRKSW